MPACSEGLRPKTSLGQLKTPPKSSELKLRQRTSRYGVGFAPGEAGVLALPALSLKAQQKKKRERERERDAVGKLWGLLIMGSMQFQ